MKLRASIAITSCCTAILVLVLAGAAVAQSAPTRVVQSTDGTIYLIKDGTRYAIAAEPVSDDELASYVDGGLASAAQFGASPELVVPAADPIPAAAAPPPPQTAPPPPAAPAGPTFTSVTGATPGRSATVQVQSTAGDTCSIAYTTPVGTRSTAAGLGAKTANAAGVVSWSFLIGTATRPGSGSVRVTCGSGSITSAITIG